MLKLSKYRAYGLIGQAIGLVCLLCIPYTESGIRRDPKALGDHLLPQEMPAAAVEKKIEAAAPVAPAAVEAALLPMKTTLEKFSDNGVFIFYQAMARLMNLNQEVFNNLVDLLPTLNDDPAIDKALREEMKKHYPLLAQKLGGQTQAAIVQLALEAAMARLNKQQQALLANQTPDAQQMLLEQLLRDRLNQDAMDRMNQGAMAPAPGYHPTGGGGGAGGGRAAAAPGAPGNERKSAPYQPPAATENKPAQTAEKKKDEPTKAAAKPKIDKEEKAETPVAANPKNETAPTAATPEPKKSWLPPIAEQALAGGNSVLNSNTPSGALPLAARQAGLDDPSASGAFPYLSGQESGAARQKFNFNRGISFGSSWSEGDNQAGEGSDESPTSGSWAPLLGGSVGATAESAAAATEPAFARPMGLTLNHLCVSGSLNCDRGKGGK